MKTTRRAAAAILLTTLTLLVAPAVGQGPLPPPSGVIGWWPLDDSAADLGTLGLNGTVAGTGGAYEPAQVLQGFRPAAPNGHVSVPDSDALDSRITL